jgi:hypothetical protein
MLGYAFTLGTIIDNKKTNLFLLFQFLLFSCSLIFSLSRAAFIIWIIGLFFFLISINIKSKISFFLIIILIIGYFYDFIISVAIPQFTDIMISVVQPNQSELNSSNEERLKIIIDATISASINPLGYGIGNYSSIYKSNYVGHISNSGENAYLTILIERGWLSFIFFIFFYLKTILYNFNKKNFTSNLFFSFFSLIYFLFNYELNNVFVAFSVFFLFFSPTFFSNNTITSND